MGRWRAGSLVVLLAATAGCGEPPPPVIAVEPASIAVTNVSDVPWHEVEVWVNDYFRGTVATLAPGGKLDVPLDTLVGGFGQRFDHRRMAVTGVDVVAKAPDNSRLRHTWGTVHRR